ncbi:helix-turn-helix domain-containing protein [Noviherbaspirillum galbum]|uniref:Helix-turn-helix transcriptional regulator n=1 Tax=Noviherbaspirillum galbum TaxID=2709383 RepID=A0A6B3SHL7_9BURK|nr:helix-turn-helix transcriptional regulator [Noviherbaspirillum galbum]NEX60150.1 helix-turn-helix transcriptional regulator [Noviherbaspirillum galbum]
MSKVAQFIDARIGELNKLQTQIAHEVGFNKPNMITMIKQGKTKLPLDKVGLMAKALECNPSDLLRLCLMEYDLETWKAIEPYLGAFLSAEEVMLVHAMRTRSVAPLENVLNMAQCEKLDEFLTLLAPPQVDSPQRNQT